MNNGLMAERRITDAAREQFMSTFFMLCELVRVCPDAVWSERFCGVPFWYHVYHAAYFIDYWLRNPCGESFRPMLVREGIPPEFEYDVARSIGISRQEMAAYLDQLEQRTSAFFSRLTDQLLAEEALAPREHLTYADIVMTQLRHVMFNIGYLNGILRSRGLPEAEWYAYNERE